MGLNLASILTESAAKFPDAPAIRLGDDELTYGALDDASARLATLLAEKGIRQGDRVGVMLPNVPQFPVAYYGVLRAGGVVVPMNVLLKRREIAFYLEDSGAGAPARLAGFLRRGARRGGRRRRRSDRDRAGRASRPRWPNTSRRRAVADTADDDTAVILYTSGTTGKPKGAELTHANLSRNADVSARTTSEIAPATSSSAASPSSTRSGRPLR